MHIMDPYIDEIIKRSNLTKLQAIAMSSLIPNIERFFDYDDIKKFKSKPSGEASTIRSQARINIMESLYTFVLGFYAGFLKKEYVLNLLELADYIKKLSEEGIYSEQAIENLDKIIKAMLI